MSIRSWIAGPWRARSLGERGEAAAASFLRRAGYRIATTRRRYRYGEIDIVAVQDRTVVFVEVKTRRRAESSVPAEAVDIARQRRLTRAGLAFLKSHGLLEYASRFDVIEVLWPRDARRPTIRHLVDAFPAAGRGQMYS